MGKFAEAVLSLLLKIGGTIYSIAVACFAVFDYVSAKVMGITAYLFDELAGLAPGETVVTFSDFQGYLSFANSVLPIQESWTLLVFMVPYCAVIVTYRFVKSWIPTMAN